jgi:hypothetical protein
MEGKPDKSTLENHKGRAEPLVDMAVRHDTDCSVSSSAAKSAASKSAEAKSPQLKQADHPSLPKVELEGCHPVAQVQPPTEPAMLQALNGKFDETLKKMTAENHHWNTFPWLQNLSEARKCYSQAGEMGRAISEWIDKTPGLKGNFTVSEGTINEGKGSDPRDFYTGNAEHNFIVITNVKDGTKYYGDPWSGKPFSRDPHTSVHNFKGQQIWEHEFEKAP